MIIQVRTSDRLEEEQNGLHFHSVKQEGVVFHLIGALSEFGKLGVLCVGNTPDASEQLYRETIAVLDATFGAWLHRALSGEDRA